MAKPTVIKLLNKSNTGITNHLLIQPKIPQPRGIALVSPYSLSYFLSK